MNAERYPICPGSKCFSRVMPGRIFCAACRERLPGETRDRIAEAWSAEGRSANFRRAVSEAMRALSR